MTSARPIEDASIWATGLIGGDLAATLAAIAIAVVGLTMLTGRISIRRSALTILGCFFLVGANAIAMGLVGLRGERNSPNGTEAVSDTPIALPQARPQSAADPYAGASLATGQTSGDPFDPYGSKSIDRR